MAIVTLDDVKGQLNLDGSADDSSDGDVLLTQKIAAAQNHIENLLGFEIETEYPDTVPPALKEAVLLLASWWYEQRETALAGMNARPIPYGVQDIVNEFRLWSFGDGE